MPPPWWHPLPRLIQTLSALGNLCLCKQYCPWRLPSWLQRPPSRAGAPKVSLLLPRKPSPKAPGLKCTGQRLCLRDLPTVSNLGLLAIVVGNEAHIYPKWDQTQVGKKSISVAPAKYWNFRGPMLQQESRDPGSGGLCSTGSAWVGICRAAAVPPSLETPCTAGEPTPCYEPLLKRRQRAKKTT